MRKLLLITCAVLFTAIGVNSCTIAKADDDETGTAVVRQHFGAREFQCGAVTLRYEMREGPGWWQSHYTVINPDSIIYDRSRGVPQYFVEWNSSTKYGEYVSLNGWRCVPR